MDANIGKIDSWIEIPSKRSSSSLSSSADEVITHGLRVGNSEPYQRQRRLVLGRHPYLSLDNERPESAAGSSQDEYTESESESEKIMSSSNEELSADQMSAENSNVHSEVSPVEEEDTDENATALGSRNRNDTCFTPQPNAFSHPPTSQTSRMQSANDSYFPPFRPTTSRSTSRRASFPAQHARQPHAPYNAALPSQQPDHDAALRASLTTLLSCAAAARGLPKTNGPNETLDAKLSPSTSKKPKQGSRRVEPSTLRIVSGPTKPVARQRQASSSPTRSTTSSEKGKRKASRSGSKERRAVKRLRSVGTDEIISPTLLTWVVSAGVLVLVSALSFSAGVTVGREAERLNVNGWSSLDGLSESSRRGSRSGLGLRRRLLHGAVRAVAA